ncbi:serine/threonine protein kinase, CMGC, dual-specificity [Coniosporium apollinis]|uniref:dual-specificity kinase n=1 Tax=Coniosporium apollinis TaxID=61459 RepID=A0ABQ9NNI8_9PEZI|nr:serine/threonine protein kinase, CMGC, dual-specificity [Coniosporium apollinis]
MAAQAAAIAHGRTLNPSLSFPRGDLTEDSGGSGAEGRARKKFQKANASENEHPLPLRKSGISVPNRIPSDYNSSLAGRRRLSTNRDQKAAPLGPRPLDRSPSKSIHNTANATSNNATTRSFLPTSTSEPFFGQPGKASNPRFSFGQSQTSSNNRTESGCFDFLPKVNFDDFHARITSDEAKLSESGHGSGGKIDGESTVIPTRISVDNERQPDIAEAPITRTSSLIRRLSNGRRKASQSSADSATMPPPGVLSVRTRRQSQFPASAPGNPAARPPRKSVGPGLITASFEAKGEQLDAINATVGGVPPNLGINGSLGKASRRGILGPSVSVEEVPRISTTARNLKTKSLQPTVKSGQEHLLPPSRTPDHSTGSSIHNARSPGRSPGQRTQTPSSSGGKRQSTAHTHHVGGLGARTISPTDARRLRRLSTMQNPPPMPQTPSASMPDLPLPDTVSDARAASRSPAMLFRKSITPSSARNTPETSRKSLHSGLSLSSSSSFNSLRASNTTLQPRASHLLSTSRLPTPKPRNVHSAAGGHEEEEVPPVPAIPKAYESPKDQVDEPFFSNQKPLPAPMEDDPWSFSMVEPATAPRPTAFDTFRSERVFSEQHGDKSSVRHKRGLTIGTGSEADKPATYHPVNKKSLQPSRLPPLNLLPLGTPTAARIASFPAPSQEVDRRQATPPPKRNYTKTPSTPMTASKATFFSKHRPEDEDFAVKSHFRSSSSHYNLRPTTGDFFNCVTSTGMPLSKVRDSQRQVATPFASASLPKEDDDFDQLRSRPSGESKHTEASIEYNDFNLTGTSSHAPAKKDPPSAHTSTSTEYETASSGASSLRRKLSMSWKRSSSKASHLQPQQPAKDEMAPLPPKHNDMPPPRLPASATWSGPIPSSPASSARPRASLESGRRKSSATTLLNNADQERTNGHKPNGVPNTQSSNQPEHPPPASRSTSSSVLAPVHRMLGTKPSSHPLKQRHGEPLPDRDDLAADEEMKKLASRRKDHEIAARELDELKRRAKPMQRVSPSQALDMVNLNIFERGEIIDYKEIYFCGTKTAKKHVGDLSQQAQNFGYDDERGDYNICLGDHIAYRYEVVDVLGKGSFGQVVRCVDHKTGGLVAVKIIRNKKRFHQQALVEVNILQKLKDWDPESKHSMISFTQSFYFRGHLCISTELLGINLYEFIKAHDFRGFSLRLIRRFTRQLLSSLVLLQSKRVIHCDLKPENILLAHPLKADIKVIDFGSSCFVDEKVYTYIQSRFYRSPEVILGCSYGLGIDMWSLGCILAELLTGYPIFPGENEQEQLACIMEIFGPPEKHLIEKSSRKKLFFDSMGKPRITVSSKGRRRRPSSKTLAQALKCEDEAFVDFVARCLRWDPERRMTPDEAVLHEFVTGVKRPVRDRLTSRTATGTNLNGAGTADGRPSPMKRVNTTQATPGTQRVRPLPEAPVTSLRNLGPTERRDVSSTNASPVKGQVKRRETVHGNALQTQPTVGVKRTSGGNPVAAGGVNGVTNGVGGVGSGTSGLPRATAAGRSFGARQPSDMASAAAVAVSQRRIGQVEARY